MPNLNDTDNKAKARTGALLRKVWIICLISAVLYFLFAGQDHSFWVEIIIVATGIGAWIYGRSLKRN